MQVLLRMGGRLAHRSHEVTDMQSFVFFLLLFIATNILRRLGWRFSRNSLYSVRSFFAVTFCISWGGCIAGIVYLLIGWLHPFWLIKWIFGYGQGAYAAVPNYGLLQESTIPPGAMLRHQILSTVPLVSYLTMAILLPFTHPV